MQTIETTPELSSIITAANTISANAGLNYIGTESVLYAIVINPDLQACKAIQHSGVNMNTLKSTIYKRMVLHLRKRDSLNTTEMPLTPAVEGLLALAGFERTEADSIGLVSAILKAENTAAARILYSFKITYSSFHQLTSKI
jgi:ATP-dependent Clp protease ATP-binding subunit ClpA